MAKQTEPPKPTRSEKDEIEARVDAMMDPAADTAAPPPLDIFAGAQAESVASAPPVPKSATKSVPAGEPPTAEALVTEPAEPIADDVPPADITVQPLNIDTPQSDAAIDDIVAQEADEVLAAEDAGLALAAQEAEASTEPIKHGHPIFWFVVLLLVIVAVAAAVLLTNPNLF